MKWDTILFLLNILLVGWMLMGTSDAAGCGNPTRLCCKNEDNTCHVVGPTVSGPSTNDRCYCDARCVSNNNCCFDYKSTCLPSTNASRMTSTTTSTTTLEPKIMPAIKAPLRQLITIPAKFKGAHLNLNLKINPDIPEKLPAASHSKSIGVYNDVTNKASMVVSFDSSSGISTPVMGSIIRGDSLYALFPANSSSDSDVTINGTKFRSVREDIKDIIQLCNIRGGSKKNLAKIFYPSRRKRQSGTNRKEYLIELLLSADFSTFLKYSNWCNTDLDYSFCFSEILQNIRNYLFLAANLVSSRFFSTANDNFIIRVRMVDILIFASREADILEGLTLPIDGRGKETLNGPEALKIFSSRLTEHYLTKEYVGKYDHATLITDYKIVFNDINAQEVHTGYSYFGGMCKLDPSEIESVSLVRNRGLFSLVASLSHQLAHSLMVLHDGVNNACDAAEQYLMAPFINQLTYRNADHINYFSTCSINYLQTYFASQGEDFCLRRNNWDSSKNSFYIRQDYTNDQYCILAFGYRSNFCQGNHQDICFRMECLDPIENRCVISDDVRAVEGMNCGDNKRCKGGRCTIVSSLVIPSPKACYYDDYIGNFSTSNRGSFHCDQLTISMARACYDVEMRTRCCQKCDQIKKALSLQTGCEYGNKDVAFCGGMTATNNQLNNLCYETEYLNKCCDNCKTTVPIRNCKYGDRADWCKWYATPYNCGAGSDTLIATTCCLACWSFNQITTIITTPTSWTTLKTTSRTQTKTPCLSGDIWVDWCRNYASQMECQDPYIALYCCYTCSKYS